MSTEEGSERCNITALTKEEGGPEPRNVGNHWKQEKGRRVISSVSLQIVTQPS